MEVTGKVADTEKMMCMSGAPSQGLVINDS